MTEDELVLAMRDVKGGDIDRIVTLLEQILEVLLTIHSQLALNSGSKGEP